MSGREGKCAGTMEWVRAEGRERAGPRLSGLVSHPGGKKKPLKQPKKQDKEMDEIRLQTETEGRVEVSRTEGRGE